MFNYNDKITLTGANIFDKNGYMIPDIIKFPLKDDYQLSKNIRQISIFEYDSYCISDISPSFNIYVGEVCSLLSFVDKFKNNMDIEDLPTKEFNIGSQPLCYNINDKGIATLFAIVNDGDIVVGSSEELKSVLDTISKEFYNIKRSVIKIKELSKDNR